MTQDNSYSKYITENDNFFYDEGSDKKGAFNKQDSELFDDARAAIPGSSIRVKRVSDQDDWQILVNGKDYLFLKGSRFSSKEREFLRTSDGLVFIIDGIKHGWNSVSEFKRKLGEKMIIFHGTKTIGTQTFMIFTNEHESFIEIPVDTKMVSFFAHHFERLSPDFKVVEEPQA